MRRTTDISFGDHVDGHYDVADQLRSQLAARTHEALERGRARKATISTLEELSAHQAWLADQARAAVGDLPEDREPPGVTVTGTIDRGDHLIDKVLLDCGDGTVITANLYRPAGRTEPGPAVLFCCGHSLDGKAAPAYQEASIILVRAGFVVLNYDSIGQGERLDFLDDQGRPVIAPNVAQHDHLGVKVRWVGDSPARYFVTDARRALDHLVSRDDVDPERIAVMGNSGGGTMTTWLTMVEPRIAAAAIGCFLTGIEEIQGSARAQDAEQIIPGGVAEGIDHDDFLLAMVPRPTIVVSKRSDFFPMEGTVRNVARARPFFELAGVRERLHQVRDDGVHGLSPALDRAAAEFLAEHLGATAVDTAPSSGEVEVLSVEELRCTESGQLATDGMAVQALRTNRERLAAHPVPEPVEAVAWLEERVRAHRVRDVELFPRWYDTSTPGIGKLMWWPEVGLVNTAVVLLPTARPTTVEILLLDKGTDDLGNHLAHARHQQLAGRAVVVVDVRGTGAVTPREDTFRALEAHYGTIFRYVNDLIALDDSLTAGRIHDVLRALDLVEDPDGLDLAGVPIEVTGSGHGAFLAVAAGTLDHRITAVTCLDEPFDPRQHVSEDYYGTDRDFCLVMPGMAQHCPQESLRAALGGKLRTS